MAFELHIVTPETGTSPSDILGHFRTGLVNCSSPIFSGITYEEETTELLGGEYDHVYVFTPVTDSTKTILFFTPSSGNGAVYVPNASGYIQEGELPALSRLMRYYTWNGGAMYFFGRNATTETADGLTLIFVKDNLGAPMVAWVSTANGVGYSGSQYTTLTGYNSNQWPFRYSSIRGMETSTAATTSSKAMAYGDDRRQCLMMPFTCNSPVNEMLYTPNAFLIQNGPRSSVDILTSWHSINFNGELFLTNTYLAFREERSSS